MDEKNMKIFHVKLSITWYTIPYIISNVLLKRLNWRTMGGQIHCRDPYELLYFLWFLLVH